MNALNALLLKGYDVKFSHGEQDTVLIVVSRVDEDKKFVQEKVMMTRDLIRVTKTDPIDSSLYNIYQKLENPFYYNRTIPTP